MAAKIKMNMKWTDQGWARLYSNMMKDSSVHAAAGVVGPVAEQAHPLRGNISIGAVAMMNEFGSAKAGVPERSFIRSSLLYSPKAKQEFRYLMADVSLDIMQRNIPRAVAMKKVGEWAVRRIKEAILSSIPPEQADSTVANKGHDHTLVHTGTLYDSIGYEIRKGIK